MTNRENLQTLEYFVHIMRQYIDAYIDTDDNYKRGIYRQDMMNEIDIYLATIDSNVKTSLLDIRECIRYISDSSMSPMNGVQKMIDLRGMLKDILEMRTAMVESMERVAETVADVNVLYDSVMYQLNDARKQESLDDVGPQMSEIERLTHRYLETFILNKEMKTLSKVEYAAWARELAQIEINITKYKEERTYEIERDERRFDEMMEELVQEKMSSVRALAERILCYAKRLEEGDKTVWYLIGRACLDHVSLVGNNEHTYLLEAITELNWDDEYSVDFVKSDIVNYKESRLLAIAERKGLKMERCSCCGELVTEIELYDGTDDKKYCDRCFKERYFVCVDCGDTFTLEDAHKTLQNGDMICEHCFEEDYFICDECGEIIEREDENYISDYERTVCTECMDEFYQRCEHCGGWIHNDDVCYSECTGYNYCRDCYDDLFTTCADCGREIERDYTHYVEDEDIEVCEDCFRKNHSVIHGYHDDNVEFETNLMPYEEIDTFTIGIEHEVGGNQIYAEGFLNVVNEHETNVYLFRDGSVDGFEIVSNPMSIRYFYEKFLPVYKKGLSYLREHGFTGKDAGGIHIHFSELTDKRQIARACNILYGDTDARKAWLKITDRTQHNMRWCSMENRRYSTLEILRDDYQTATTDRYTALNYDGDRTYTHEIRIYNSTLDDRTFISYIESTFALIDYIREDRGRGVYTTTYDYLEWMQSRENRARYATAVEVLEEKGLFEDFEIVQPEVPVDLCVNDVQLTEQEEQEIADLVEDIFNAGDTMEAVG